MSREITNILSFGIDIYNSVICLLMLVSMSKSDKRKYADILFRILCIVVLLFNICDTGTWIAEGTDAFWKVPYMHITIFLYYALAPLSFVFLLHYIEEYLYPYRVSRIYFKAAYLVSAIYSVLLILTPFKGIFYYITPDNIYHRGSYNWISLVFYICFYFISVTVIISNRKRFSRKSFLSFLSYSFFPIIMETIQIMFYGLSLVNTGMTLSILLIFMNSHKDLELSYERSSNEIREKEKKLIDFQEQTILSLSNLVENRDTETGEHAQRTSIFVELLAHQAYKDGLYKNILTEGYIRLMVKAAPMHDIGKIVVSDSVLKKPARLSLAEFELMKHHASEGGRIVKQIFGFADNKSYVKIASDMARFHHERWDGNGYPEKLKGEEIPLCARFMAIADVFDALVFERCYKKPIPPEEAFQIMMNEKGTHFDPILMDEFVKVKDEIFRLIAY